MPILASVREWWTERQQRRREAYAEERSFGTDDGAALGDERERLGLDDVTRSELRGPQDFIPPF